MGPDGPPERNAPPKPATPSEPIRRARDFAASRPGEVRSLDDLARVAGLSRYHFARRFRRETGETPWRFVRRQRVERAVRLLEEGRPPAEVAFETGFADQSHLTRTLREYDGRTPGDVRRGTRGPTLGGAARERRTATDRAPAAGRGDGLGVRMRATMFKTS
jgi:AraC family transcriptional regulator